MTTHIPPVMKVTHKTKNSERFKRLREKNQLELCLAKGCNTPRDRVSHYCKRHCQRKYKTLHPEGLLTPPRKYEIEDQMLQEVISLNIGSKPIQVALKRISSIIESANMGETWMPFPKIWQMIYDKGWADNPREVLFRFARLRVIQEMERPFEYIKSDDHLLALQGNAIFGLSMVPPEDLHRTGAKRKKMAVFVNREIGVLVEMLTKASLKRYEEQFENLSPYLSEELQS